MFLLKTYDTTNAEKVGKTYLNSVESEALYKKTPDIDKEML